MVLFLHLPILAVLAIITTSALTLTTNSLLALGDSYSAGPGAGDKMHGPKCDYWSNAYPKQVFNHQPNHRWADLEFFSCNGAKMPGVSSQIDMITSQNITNTLLSIGGNDIGFFKILNACIFRFNGEFSGNCAKVVQDASNTIDSQMFNQTYFGILDKLFGKAESTQLIVTGYYQFFNADTTQCNTLRNEANALLLKLNNRLQSLVEDYSIANPHRQAYFVSADDAYEGHRFCEQNVKEPTDDPQTYFFEAKDDKDRNPPLKGDPAWEGVNADTCLVAAKKSGDWGELAVCYMAKMHKRHPMLESPYAYMSILDWGKVFHPKSEGHTVTAKAVLDKIGNLTQKVPSTSGQNEQKLLVWG